MKMVEDTHKHKKVGLRYKDKKIYIYIFSVIVEKRKFKFRNYDGMQNKSMKINFKSILTNQITEKIQ